MNLPKNLSGSPKAIAESPKPMLWLLALAHFVGCSTTLVQTIVSEQLKDALT